MEGEERLDYPQFSKCLFDSMPDQLCLLIMERIGHAGSLCQFGLAALRFHNLVLRTPRLKFFASDFQAGSAREAELIVTKMVMQSSCLTSLHVEAPNRSFKFQELAIIVWFMHLRNTLEDITIIDAPNDPMGEYNTEEWKLEHASMCKYLKRLQLHNAIFDHRYGLNCKRFESLKMVSLSHVVIMGEVIKDLIRQCPILEEIFLVSCSGIGPLDLIHTPCPKLRRFEMSASNIDGDLSLELFRLNAPNLQVLVLIVDGIPDSEDPENPLAWGRVNVEDGRLHELQLDLNGPFTLRIAPRSMTNLQNLHIMGDNWPWEIVYDLLGMCKKSLESLNLGANIILPDAVDKDLFFSEIPKLRYLSMATDFCHLLAQAIPDEAVITLPELMEVHVEFLAYTAPEVKLVAALLRGCPKLKIVKPIYTTVSRMDNGISEADADFWKKVETLRANYPNSNIF